jgi:predicted nucleotidyltransferase
MLNETELRILAAFFPEGTERTTKEIEERSGYSHERAHSTLNALEKKALLTKKKVGKTSVYSIIKFNDDIYLAFAHYSVNRKKQFVEKYPPIWNALEEFISKSKPDSAILFGSYTKGEAREGSDVDILCINGDAKAEKTALSLRHKHNLRVTPVIVKREDFRNIKTENPEFWEDLVNYGIILKGQELFYELVYVMG